METRTEAQAEARAAYPATPASLVTFDKIEAALRAVPVTRLPEVYEILLAMLEDAEDLAAIEAAQGEPTRSFSEFVDELKRENLYP